MSVSGMGINHIFRFILFAVITVAGLQAWAKTLHSPKISGQLHNRTLSATSDLKISVTAVCVRRFSTSNEKTCGQTRTLVSLDQDGSFTIPALSVKVKGYRLFNRPKLKMAVNVLLPDGQYILKQDPTRVVRDAINIEAAIQILKQFTLFQVGGHDLQFMLPGGEPIDNWLASTDPDARLHLNFRILSGDILPFTDKVYGDVFAYIPFVKSSTLKMPAFYLAFPGDYTTGQMVNMEYIVTADGRYTASDYFRFNDHVEMSSEILLPFLQVTLNPTGCCHGDSQN